ncbi:DUF4241 domain-containing protein [Spirillospora sp. NPDC048819]|uniref:DUF4241 domain-containing protein n=1 Tax=Spirillospora sp. NPDC048819 TaxID=3155268 RepID=UPI0033E36C62
MKWASHAGRWIGIVFRPERRRELAVFVAVLALAVAALTPFAALDRTPAQDEGSAREVPPLRTAGFDDLFEPGRAVTSAGRPGTIETRQAGRLDVPSGKLIACDPFVQGGDPGYEKPFTVTVAPGRYPVWVSLVRYQGDSEQTYSMVAAVKVAIRTAPAVRWELALQPGQDPGELEPDHFYGFGVDTGTGAFLDASAGRALSNLATSDGLLVERLDGAYITDIRDPATRMNIVAYYSGWGDGAYPTWIGRAADGAPTAFVTDLHVIDYRAQPS